MSLIAIMFAQRNAFLRQHSTTAALRVAQCNRSRWLLVLVYLFLVTTIVRRHKLTHGDCLP